MTHCFDPFHHPLFPTLIGISSPIEESSKTYRPTKQTSWKMLHLLLLLLQLPSLQLLSSAYTPPDKYFIDCGSNSNTTFPDGRIFVGDLNPPFSLSSRKSNPVRDNNPLSNISSLYHTARIYREPSSYELQVNQNGTYMVRLHFFCFSSPINLSDAVFDVWVDPPSFNVLASGFLLLSNFSCQNSSNLPVIEEFLLTINQGKFRLYFIPSQESSFAFISAIEIFPTPENFIPDSVARLTSESNGNYSGLLSRVLHTIHRIDIGGPKITPDNDRLWRNWVPDDRYLVNPDATKNSQFYSDRLDDQSEGFTNYSGPDYVYKTAKEMNISCKQAIVSNIIWHFPVVKNAMQHLVRVHFCNLVSRVPSLLEFSISVNCKFEKRIKVYSMINDLAAPFYFDFVVDSDGFEYVDISIALLPENIADRNASLNGLEIFEIKKKSGALPIQAEPMKMNQSTADGSYLGFVMVMGIIALIPDLKRRRGKLATEESNSQDCPAERNKIIPVAWNFDRGLKISFSKIRKGTKDFDSKLLIGEGRFGKVYKGTLQGTRVAVKRCIPRDGQDFMEFETEIMVSSRIRHLHLVPLIGYCDEKSEKILISEYMELGSLRDHLYGFRKMHSTLSWVKRLEICIGVAKGLNYLHTGSAEGIIHRDVTSANILLDQNFVAKISGFGLCKSSLSEPHTSVEGTLGYVDPEYVSHSVCTEKSDVYSFGVVLLEVLCARPPVLASSQREDASLVERAMVWQQKGQLEKIIDPVLVDNINLNSLKVVGEIAVKCLNIRGAQRPTMQEVEWHLIYALNLQQEAVQVEPNEGGSTSHSLDIALLIAQPMLSLDNLAKRTANIPIARSLNLEISLAKLRKATNNFDAKLLLGEGGFGKVYKGTLQGIKVAVKRSRFENRQSFLQFETEIKMLSKIHHRHLVQLIGYCAEKSEMMIVYGFMENGVLRNHLYESRNSAGRSLTRFKLSWERRLEICIGVAKGLHHLHAGSDVRIIHRDINSTNILLDENYVAKVADFGFSRQGLSDSSLNVALSTTLLGTLGYLDPEYFYSSRCTTKSDVYSFGVVLLEVLCARPPIIHSSDREERNLVEWAMLWHRKGQLKKIVDPVLVGEANPDSLRVVGEIAEKCLNASSAERPTMQEVEWHLIYALNLQQHAGLLGSYEDNACTRSVNITIPSDGHMFYEESLTEGTANISISPNLNLDLKISLAEIKKATNNFDARLLIGEGGFGKVYKGTLKGISVAVKRSEPGHDQGFMGFQREIMVFSQIQHPHLVSFIGYCDERSEMILIYKFVENGALRDYLYNSKGKTERSSTQFNLSWEKRLEICIGAAKGLHYLHTGLAEGIIHRDVKAANILLDKHFAAKVADFGISKLGSPDPLHYSLVVKGTIGYVDPEVLTFGEFTKKSDVYAFGVVLLEVICARPAIIASSQREEINLAEWGMIWQRKGQLEKIMDPVLVGEINMSSLRVVGETAEKCLKLNGAERPTMQEVELQLKYALELQQSALQRVSCKDCSTSASVESALPSVQHMLSNPFHVEEDDVFIQVDDDFDSLGGDDASDSFFSANSSPNNLV